VTFIKLKHEWLQALQIRGDRGRFIPSCFHSVLYNHPHGGRSMTTVSLEARLLKQKHRPPTAAGRIQAQVRLCEVCGGRSGIAAGFIRALQFPLPTVPPTAHHSVPSLIRDWYSGANSDRPGKRAESHTHPKEHYKHRVYQCVGLSTRNKQEYRIVLSKFARLVGLYTL
jgi:hypothetical protein